MYRPEPDWVFWLRTHERPAGDWAVIAAIVLAVIAVTACSMEPEEVAYEMKRCEELGFRPHVWVSLYGEVRKVTCIPAERAK